MSVVIAVCGSFFAEMISDSRKVKFVDGRNREVEEIVDENTQKIFKINSNVLIGFAGNYNNMIDILKYLESFVSIEIFSLEMIRRKVINMAKKQNHDFIPLQIIICGKNSESEYEISELSSLTNFYDNSKKPKGKNIKISSALPREEYLEVRNKIIDERIPHCTTPMEIRKYSEEFIKYISSIDKTVNDRIMLEKI